MASRNQELRARAEALRREADAIEAADFKAERLKTADTIPTCPNCGGRDFKIYAWTIVAQSIVFEDDDPDGNWGDDYESGDHTDQNQDAICNGCDADVQAVLEKFGWKFYAEPQPVTPNHHHGHRG